MTLRWAAPAAALAAVAFVLSGCGGGHGPSPGPPGPAPKPPGPVECSGLLQRGHCKSCYWTGEKTVCKACSGGYELDGAAETPELFCTFNCSTVVPKPIPSKPANPADLNGIEWPSVCIGESVSKFFTIGDWGGVCGWGGGNKCSPDVKPNMCACGPDCGDKGKPCPMPNRPGGHYVKEIEGVAQRLVSDVMLKRQKELKEAGTPARYIVNVGDNFYPGGIDLHCGQADKCEQATQFGQVWKSMYPEDLAELEWWSVLGNHDYGGVCYIKGWDQQIWYTWHDSKWVMPGQFWRRSVQYTNFKVDFFFIDGNVFDTTAGTTPSHNLCSRESNPGIHCELSIYPGDGGNCAATGPHSQGGCSSWFGNLWEQNYNWLNQVVPKSDADWQIVVNHYPPTYALGYAPKSYMDWAQWMPSMGIDLMITGHTHEQKVYYGDFGPGRNMGPSAWVITGGGGGVTTEETPSPNGEDDAYGFMEMTISLESIDITAFSHGGTEGKKIIRNQTSVKPVEKKSRAELVRLGYLAPEEPATEIAQAASLGEAFVV